MIGKNPYMCVYPSPLPWPLAVRIQPRSLERCEGSHHFSRNRAGALTCSPLSQPKRHRPPWSSATERPQHAAVAAIVSARVVRTGRAWSWEMGPPSALLLHAATPCNVATRQHAGLRRATGHKSQWGGTMPQAWARRSARSSSCSRASAPELQGGRGSWPRPATGQSRQWAAPLPPPMRLPHSLATPARAAHDLPSSPFDIQDISLPATWPWALYCGSHDRRDPAT